MKVLIFLLIIFIPTIVFSEPNIELVSGIVEDGEEVIIYGSGFGSTGPNVILFDDFSRGKNGEGVSNDGTIGQWTSTGSIIWEDSMLSHGKGARTILPGGRSIHRLIFDDASEVFISSVAYVPDGYRFPSADDLETMPTISALKHHWVYYGSNGYAGGKGHDMFGPSWTGSGSHTITSNESKTYVYQRWGAYGWEWGKPVRWTHWLKGNGMSSKGTEGFFQGITPAEQIVEYYNETNMDGKVWFTPNYVGEGMPYAWDRISIPGYLRGGSYPQDNYVIDDVYVAIGPGAAARVEVGNNPDYTSCTKMAISTPNSWNGEKIKFTVREGSFKFGDTAYLFVVDATNSVSEGYPITFGKTSGAPISNPLTLHPPKNLEVVIEK